MNFLNATADAEDKLEEQVQCLTIALDAMLESNIALKTYIKLLEAECAAAREIYRGRFPMKTIKQYEGCYESYDEAREACDKYRETLA